MVLQLVGGSGCRALCGVVVGMLLLAGDSGGCALGGSNGASDVGGDVVVCGMKLLLLLVWCGVVWYDHYLETFLFGHSYALVLTYVGTNLLLALMPTFLLPAGLTNNLSKTKISSENNLGMPGIKPGVAKCGNKCASHCSIILRL